MKATRATKIPNGWSNGGGDMRSPSPRAPDHSQAIRLVDYLRLVIASLQTDYGCSEDEAAERTLSLTTVLCISDALWEGYTPEATACAVVQLHRHNRLS